MNKTFPLPQTLFIIFLALFFTTLLDRPGSLRAQESNNNNNNTSTPSPSPQTQPDDSPPATTDDTSSPTEENNNTSQDPAAQKMMEKIKCSDQDDCIDKLIKAEDKLYRLIEILQLFDDAETQSKEKNCLTQRCVNQNSLNIIVTSDDAYTYSVNFGTPSTDGGLHSNQKQTTSFMGVLGRANSTSKIGCRQSALSRVLIKGTEHKVTKIQLFIDYSNQAFLIFDSDNGGEGWDGQNIEITKKEFVNNPAWSEAVKSACQN